MCTVGDVDNSTRALLATVLALALGCGCNTFDDAKHAADLTADPLPDPHSTVASARPPVATPPNPAPVTEPRKQPFDGPDPTAPTSTTTPAPVFVGTPPPNAFEPPSNWPQQAGDALPLDPALLSWRCQHDARGNRVCLWSPGTGIDPGPCAFAPDGTLVLAGQVAWPDYRALPQSAWPSQWTVSTVLIAQDAVGAVQWARAWHRVGSPPALNIAANALAVDADGSIVWAGEDCVPDSPHPPAADGGYFDSCLDALVVKLSSQGEPTFHWNFGTSNGLERVSDMRIDGDGGMYLAGIFHAPLELPGRSPLASKGGADLFLLHLDNQRAVTWADTWGTAANEGNGVRLAGTPEGGVIATGSLEGAGETGFVARFAADGGLDWERDALPVYIAYPASMGDDAVVESGGALARIGAAGPARAWADAPALGIAKKQPTPDGDLLLVDMTGSHLIELDPDGDRVRQLQFEGADGRWYRGGLCVAADGRVAISGTVTRDSDFGILEQPLSIDAPTGFALVLVDW